MKFKLLTLCLLVAVAFTVALPVTAETGYFGQDNEFSGVTTGLDSESSLIKIIAGLINVFIGLLGIIAVILMLYGGFVWMTAAGDPEKVKKAQDIIKMAIIGIIVIFAAWALANFALDYIANQAFTV